VEASYFVLPAILLLTALALVMSGIAIMFQIRRDRLPDATRFENIQELRAQESSFWPNGRAELSIVEQKDTTAGSAHCRGGRALKNGGPPFWPNLLPWTVARHEIEEVKSEARCGCSRVGWRYQELTSKKSELEKLDSECNPRVLQTTQRELERSERNVLKSTQCSLRFELSVTVRSSDWKRQRTSGQDCARK